MGWEGGIESGPALSTLSVVACSSSSVPDPASPFYSSCPNLLGFAGMQVHPVWPRADFGVLLSAFSWQTEEKCTCLSWFLCILEGADILRLIPKVGCGILTSKLQPWGVWGFCSVQTMPVQRPVLGIKGVTCRPCPPHPPRSQ